MSGRILDTVVFVGTQIDWSVFTPAKNRSQAASIPCTDNQLHRVLLRDLQGLSSLGISPGARRPRGRFEFTDANDRHFFPGFQLLVYGFLQCVPCRLCVLLAQAACFAGPCDQCFLAQLGNPFLIGVQVRHSDTHVPRPIIDHFHSDQMSSTHSSNARARYANGHAESRRSLLLDNLTERMRRYLGVRSKPDLLHAPRIPDGSQPIS